MHRGPGVKGEKIGPPPFPTPTQQRHRLVFAFGEKEEQPPASLRSLSRSAFSFALLRPSQSLGLASDALVPPARPRRSSSHQASLLFRHFQLPVLSCAPNIKARDQERQTTGPRPRYPRQPIQSTPALDRLTPSPRTECLASRTSEVPRRNPLPSPPRGLTANRRQIETLLSTIQTLVIPPPKLY